MVTGGTGMSDNSIAIGINRFVSIHNAVQNAIDDLGVSGEYRRIFIRWAIEADMRIGGIRALEEKSCCITVCGCSAELPMDAVAISNKGIVLGSCDGECDTRTLFNDYWINREVQVGGFCFYDFNGKTYSFFDRYRILDNKISFFDDRLDGKMITVYYVGYKTDCDGFPMVKTNHIEALTEWIIYKYYRRTKTSATEKRIVSGDVTEQRQVALFAILGARAEDGEPTQDERDNIISAVNSPFTGTSDFINLYATETWI